MKRITLFVVTLLFVFVSSQSVYARYIVEHQQLHEIIGQHTLTDFTTVVDGFEITAIIPADLPQVVFDEPLDLSDVDRFSITITGTISPVTVCGNGNPRPDECYVLNAGINHNWLPHTTLGNRNGRIDDPQGVFSDDDSAFEVQWVYDLSHDFYPLPILTLCEVDDDCVQPIDIDSQLGDIFLRPSDPPAPIESLQFVVGPLTSEMQDIPHYWMCLAYGDCIINPANGLEVASPITLTITDAYITREWGIPEPGSLAVFSLTAFGLLRRR